MRLEVHTFDRELLSRLMGQEEVPEGSELSLEGVRLRYERTFTGRVRAFPQILYFDIEVRSDEAASAAVDWFMGRTSGRAVEKVVVSFEDTRMDAQEMRRLLCQGKVL